MPTTIAPAALYVRSSALLLFTTGLAKFASAFGSAEALSLPDPLLGWSVRTVLIMAALAETIVVGILISKSDEIVKIAAIFSLAMAFLSYRICTSLIGAPHPCPCMGNIYEIIGVERKTIDLVMKLLLIYLLSGGLYCLSTSFREFRRRSVALASEASS